MTVCWSNSTWPPFCKLSMLQLHGVKQVALDCPTVNKPGWRSLIARHDLNDIRERSRVIGSDKLVNLLHLAPGLIIGLWRGNGSIAVVMMNLHFHKLVERSLLGSSICAYTVPEDRPPFDDVDPEYGLHGYTVHILLHNTVKHIMSGHFSQLFCKTDQIRDQHIQLKAIDKNDLSQHTPLSGKISLPWKTEGLEGCVPAETWAQLHHSSSSLSYAEFEDCRWPHMSNRTESLCLSQLHHSVAKPANFISPVMIAEDSTDRDVPGLLCPFGRHIQITPPDPQFLHSHIVPYSSRNPSSCASHFARDSSAKCRDFR
ncbi:hypothetical protein JZ751_003938, partial [Albula glossodonta]